MDNNTLYHIDKSQKIYLNLLNQYKFLLESDNIDQTNLSMLFDEVNFFWHKNLEIIEYELDKLVKNNICFLLSGAVYLNINEYERYYFKSFGDYHIISEPLLKMELFFKNRNNNKNLSNTKEYFMRVFNDVINVLSDYSNFFYILPIRLIFRKSIKNINEYIEKLFFDFMSSLFNKKFNDRSEFNKIYKSYEQIEKNIEDKKLERLIFNTDDTKEKSLREKIEQYTENIDGFNLVNQQKSESKVFLVSVYTYVSQILDIILTCNYFDMYPYIRNRVTFNYFHLFMTVFLEDNRTKKIIEKAIIFYIFIHTINPDIFKNICFTEYCNMIEDKNFLEKIITEIRNNEIDIFSTDSNQIKDIIKEKFEI